MRLVLVILALCLSTTAFAQRLQKTPVKKVMEWKDRHGAWRVLEKFGPSGVLKLRDVTYRDRATGIVVRHKGHPGSGVVRYDYAGDSPGLEKINAVLERVGKMHWRGLPKR